jgi:hypothetical protein
MPSFVSDARDLATDAELGALRTLLASDPAAGDLIPGTGGFRKLRIGLSRQAKGKSSGARVVYLHQGDDVPIALVAIYAKGEKIDLSAAERVELKRLSMAYAEAFADQRASGSARRRRMPDRP